MERKVDKGEVEAMEDRLTYVEDELIRVENEMREDVEKIMIKREDDGDDVSDVMTPSKTRGNAMLGE